VALGSEGEQRSHKQGLKDCGFCSVQTVKMDLESRALSVCEAGSPAVASLRYLQNAKRVILAAQDRVRS